MNDGTIIDQGIPSDIFDRGVLQKIGLHPPKVYDYCSKIPNLTPSQKNSLPFSFRDYEVFLRSMSKEQRSELARLLQHPIRINLKTDQELILDKKEETKEIQEEEPIIEFVYCPECGHKCKGQKGLKVHIYRAHDNLKETILKTVELYKT